MKKLKKGPELKMPELKVPAAIADLYYDLRERRLLPLVALAIVAIVAVPFLLGGGAEKPPPRPAASGSLGAAEASSSTLTVVQAQPGLRAYRKRLRARTATDPFVQRYATPDLAGTKLGGGEEPEASGGGSESTTETTTTTTKNSSGTTTETTSETGGKTGGAPSTGGNGGGGGKTPPLTVFAFTADIQYSHTEEKADGSTAMSAPTKREKVRPYTPLPGEKEPVVTYLGVGAGAKTALLMISKDVTAVFGDGKCVSGTDTCELLEVETGLPETFEYGPNHVRYKINVLKIVPVPTGKL